MTDTPTYVYLIRVPGEWPVTVVVDYGDPDTTAREVEDAVKRRKRNGATEQFRHDWDHPLVVRARLADLVEVELTPSRTVGPSLDPIGEPS